MICQKGKCIKCGASIVNKTDGGPATNYVERLFKLSDGAKLKVAFCASCEPVEEDWKPIIEALNKFWKGGGFEMRIEGEIEEELLPPLYYKGLIAKQQGGLCYVCGQELGESYILSKGFGYHQTCSMTDALNKK